MGSIDSTYVEPSGTGDPNPDVVEVTRTAPVDQVIYEAKYDPADPQDIRIVNWIGKFVKPLEDRITMLERQVDLLMSLQSKVEVEFRSKNENNEVSGT